MTGLLIGYFEPLHLGHLMDINAAAGQTDMLHVVVLPKNDTNQKFCPTLQDKAKAVQVACRFFGFIKVHTSQSLGIQGAYTYDEPNKDHQFNDTVNQIIQKLQLNRSKIFCQSACLPKVQGFDVVPLPAHRFDSSAIYNDPITHFGCIAPHARQDYTQTVCIVGGESSGKTTLVHKLANHFGASYALEMGRLYVINELGGTEIGLQYSDYPLIAAQHYQAVVDAKASATSPITLIDTDFVTTQAFCKTYEGRPHPLLDGFIDSVRLDYTLMLSANVAWVADGMRSLGLDTKRAAFENTLLTLYQKHHIRPYLIDDKDYHQRYQTAVNFINTQVLNPQGTL